MAMRTLWSPALLSRAARSLLAGFALGAALVALEQAGAQAIARHNSDAPVNYAADRIELQDKQKRVVLSGNVDITQADLRMRAARTTVAYTDAGSLKIKVASTIVAISSIHLLQIFLNIASYTDNQVMWLTIMHMAFVISALFLAYIDRVMSMTKKDKGSSA